MSLSREDLGTLPETYRVYVYANKSGTLGTATVTSSVMYYPGPHSDPITVGTVTGTISGSSIGKTLIGTFDTSYRYRAVTTSTSSNPNATSITEANGYILS